jgi:GNAT superfamily N-acetyltransferase
MSITYRTATLGYAPAVADLHSRSWRSAYRGSYRDEYLDGPVQAERLEVWTSRLTDPPTNQHVVIAEEDGKVVGFACVYGGHDEDGSFLDNIHADPQRHGEGIGSGLFSAVVDWCRVHYPEQGLHLKVLDGNAKARRFYENRGAVDRGGTPPSTPWVIEGVEVRSYAWPALDAATSPSTRGG